MKKQVNVLKGRKKREVEAFNPKKYVSKDIDEKDVIQIKQVFDLIDSGGKGYLQPKDIALVLQREGFNALRETIYDIVAEYDEYEEGGIIFEQFMRIMRSKPADKQSMSDIHKVFRKYDRKNKGYIDKDDIRQMSIEMKEDLDDETIRDIMRKADPTGKGQISLDEFYNIMTRQLFYI